MAQPSPYLADRIRPSSFGDAAAAMNNPGVTQPRSTFGSMAAQAATPAAPAVPAAADAPSASPSNLYMQDRAQELKDQWGQGQYAQAIGTAARTAIQGAGMYALEAGDKLTSPWIDAAKGFGRGLVGDAAAQPAAPAAPAPVGPSNPTDQRLAAGTQASPPPASSPATPDNQVMPGVFNHGRGQYSDQAGGMGMPSSFTGQPNAQNLAAAEALSQRGAQAALAQPPRSMMEAAGITAPTVRHSGNDWQARNDLRNLQVSASSITNRPEWQSGSTTQAWGTRGNTGRADPDGKIAAFNGALAADVAARGAQPGVDLAAMRENAGLQRTAMQQQGANQRSLWQYALDQQRINQAGETAGYANRAAAQQEQLRSQLVSEQDPARRQTIAQRLRELQGQAEPPAFKSHVIPNTRNVDGSTTMGGVYQENTRTGEGRWVPQPGQGGAQSPTVGTVQQGYRFKGG